MTRRLVVSVIVILIIIVILLLRSAGQVPETAIVLQMVNGRCVPSDPAPLIRRGLRTVTWHVTNQDCAPQYVAVRNFREQARGENARNEPGVINPEPATPTPDRPIPTGATVDMTARVTKFLLFGEIRFKYQIFLGTTQGNLTLGRDPDIDVWPAL